MRNILRIPATNTPFEAYLESEFFKEQASQLNSRRREGRARTKKRHCTNYTFTPFGVDGREVQVSRIERSKGATPAQPRHIKNKSDLNNLTHLDELEEGSSPNPQENPNEIVHVSPTKQLTF
jgi:hypothetical protein